VLSGLTHAPGVVDPVTALLAVQQGFSALHLSGAVVSATRLGRPDLGFVDGTDIAAVAAQITRVVQVPLIADADTGYGGVLQVARTVEDYARAGVAALHLEDQVSPKRCGHLAGKEVLSLEEAVAKVRAAVDVQGLVVIARTDALSVLGLEEAVRRAHAFAEAGADLVFVEGARTAEQLAAVGLPQVLNRSQAGEIDDLDDATLEELQVRVVIHPVAALLAMTAAAREAYRELRESGRCSVSYGWSELTDLIGLPEALLLEQGYA
jgi:2-methylisocitrate lyase-like PEP mutase family enzyme